MKSMNLYADFRRASFFLLALPGLFGGILFFYSAFLKINYPYLVGLGEPALSQAVRYFSEGKIPYHDLSAPPFSLVPYGPVYLVLAGASRAIFSSPFVGGRLVTLFSTAVLCFFIYAILKNAGARRDFSLAGISLFICHPFVQLWGVQVNVDMTAVCLTTASFYFLWKYTLGNYRQNHFLAAGVFFSVTAFFTKSSMAAVPAAFFWFLLFQKKFKLAAVFFLLEAALCGLIYLALNHWTQGGYFFHTTYEIGKRRVFYQLFFRYWWVLIRDAPVFIPLILFGFSEIFQKGKRQFFGFYVLFVLILTFSLAKQGSDTNYFLELCVAASLSLGMTLENYFARRAWVQAAVYAVLAAQILAWVLPVGDLKSLKAGYDAGREYFDRVSQLVKKTRGDILSEDMSLLVANGKEIFYEPFPMAQMSYSGAWDEKPILDALDKQLFSVAILYFYAPSLRASRTFTPSFLKMFNQKYRFIGRSTAPVEARSLASNALYFYERKR